VSIGNIKPLFTGPLFTAHLPVPPSSPPVPTPRSREPSPAAPTRQRPTSPAGSRPALQAQTGWGLGDGQPARRGRRLGEPASNAMSAAEQPPQLPVRRGRDQKSPPPVGGCRRVVHAWGPP